MTIKSISLFTKEVSFCFHVAVHQKILIPINYLQKATDLTAYFDRDMPSDSIQGFLTI